MIIYTLYTFLCEVEAILNDHPIAKISDDPDNLEPPNHILLLKSKPALPPRLSRKVICTPNSDGGKFSFSQIFSATDGFRGTYHCYRIDNDCHRTQDTGRLLLPLVDPGCRLSKSKPNAIYWSIGQATKIYLLCDKLIKYSCVTCVIDHIGRK